MLGVEVTNLVQPLRLRNTQERDDLVAKSLLTGRRSAPPGVWDSGVNLIEPNHGGARRAIHSMTALGRMTETW